MTLTGDWTRLAKALGRLARTNTEEIAQQIGESLLNSTRRRFTEGKGPDGEAWPKSARVQAKGGQTLVHRRRLERSITYKVSPGRVDVGTNDKRAAVHQEGKTIKPRRAKALRFRVPAKSARKKWAWATVKSVTMPARPFIGISTEDQEAVDQIIAEYVKERVR
ncbi:MAG: phage virion morphogenesis protein [Bacillota bacterium]